MISARTIRQAVTAVENKESARQELHKEDALWRIALDYGLVFDAVDLIQALGVNGTGSARRTTAQSAGLKGI